ncbi:Dynein light chain [Heracleum sosnowskyi]|uniref:Dynein light chain n=1 Tax=Heracleum sosnowskyi TaxID=360622 RepID=A0AAD8M5E6_9APIA|nr:Dynein light chain [Heracleum sosnowskyi]
MLEGKTLIEDTDMPLKMQIQAVASASQDLDLYDVLDCKSYVKRVDTRVSALTQAKCISMSYLILTRGMGNDGSVLWVQTLDVSLLTLHELSFNSLWKLSTFLSSKLLLGLNHLHVMKHLAAEKCHI